MSWLKRPNIFKKKDSGNEDAKDPEKEKADSKESGETDENSNNSDQAPGSPPPGTRSETAGSVRSRIQPTLMEVPTDHQIFVSSILFFK